jgi:hypothetical protein
MAGAYVSDAFADIIVNAVLTRDVSAIPTSYFFGLTLEVPTDQNGSGLVVPTPAEYARIEVTAESTSWNSAGVGSRVMVTEVDIVWEEAVTDWGNIKGYTIYDSLTDGVYLGYGLILPYIISAGMTARLPAGSVAVRLPI